MNNTTTNQINHYYQVYLQEARCAKCLSPQTLKTYESVIKNFFSTMPEVQSLDQLSPTIVVEFFKRIHRRARMENREVKSSTILTYYTKLNIFFKWLEYHNYLTPGTLYNQVPKPRQPEYTDVKALIEVDVEKLIATISIENINNTFLRSRDMALFYVLVYTGIRRGELLGLHVYDIDFENKMLHVRGRSSKSRRSRNIPMNPILVLSLQKYFEVLRKRKIQSGNLFVSSKSGNALTKHGLKSWVNKYKKLSGVHFSFHRLRHTFACSLAKQNADIVSIKCALGHSSVRMTDRYLRSIGSENARVYIDQLSF